MAQHADHSRLPGAVPTQSAGHSIHPGDTDTGPDGATAHRMQTSKRSWVVACVLGELAGFIPPAVTGAVLFWLDAPEVLLIAGLVAAGVAEGLVLGFAQSKVVTQLLPGLTGWTRATAFAAGIAWLAGMGGSSLVQAVGPIGLLIAVPGWIIGLVSMGYLQSRRLDQVVDGAHHWVPVTCAAWLVGVMMPVVILSIIPNGWPLAVHIIAAVAAAVAMGATVGVISAGTLFDLAMRSDVSQSVSRQGRLES